MAEYCAEHLENTEHIWNAILVLKDMTETKKTKKSPQGTFSKQK